MTMTKEDILEAIKSLSVLDLVDLVHFGGNDVPKPRRLVGGELLGSGSCCLFRLVPPDQSCLPQQESN